MLILSKRISIIWSIDIFTGPIVVETSEIIARRNNPIKNIIVF